MIKFKYVSLVCFLFLSAHGFSQAPDYMQYYKYCGEALTLKVNGDYAKAVEKFEEAFAAYFPFIDDLEDLKDCYKRLEKPDMVKRVWERMVVAGFKLHEKSYFIDPSGPIKCEWSARIPADEEHIIKGINYDSLRAIFLAGMNVERDMYLRAIMMGECFADRMRAHCNDKNIRIVEDAGFSNNAQLFVNLAKSEHLPSRRESDVWNDLNFIIGLTHMAGTLTGKTLDNFLEILKQNMIAGNISARQYANLFDHGHKGKMYGTSTETINKITDKIVLAAPRDIQNVDRRRAEICLPPLWVHAASTGFALPKGYKP